MPSGSRASAANALEELYAAAPEDFVAERNRLERALRAEGLAEDADELAKLKKPTIPVFVVNQLARARERDVRELLESAEKLIRGLEAGDAKDAGARQGELAERVHLLASQAEAATGRSLSGAVQQRVVALLRLAALDRDNAPRLRAGTLAEELEPTGFDALAGLQLARPAQPAKRREASERTATEDKRAGRIAQLERELADARAELHEAEATVREAERAAVSARRTVDRLSKRLERAKGT